MTTLSTKVTGEEAAAFREFAGRAGLTANALLREFVAGVVGCRRLELGDPEVGPPIGWVWLQDRDVDDEQARRAGDQLVDRMTGKVDHPRTAHRSRLGGEA